MQKIHITTFIRLTNSLLDVAAANSLFNSRSKGGSSGCRNVNKLANKGCNFAIFLQFISYCLKLKFISGY